MITMWKQKEEGIFRTAILETHSWLHVTAPTPLEMDTLKREYGIPTDVVQDILDPDERPRSEKEEEYHLIILRIPAHAPDMDVPYHTIPLGIILFPGIIFTICKQEVEYFDAFFQNRIKGIKLQNKADFVLRLILHSASLYLRYLKDINRKTGDIENELHKSVKNNELIRLLNMEKSLVFFTTSLKGNELLIEKLKKSLFNGRHEINIDLLEDVITENRQAIEMSNIYTNILSGMMDAFASVISNNLNVVMKRLTSISLILMIPTLIASVYGMNITLPFQQSPLAFLGIIAGSVVLSVLGIGLFLGKRFH